MQDNLALAFFLQRTGHSKKTIEKWLRAIV